MASSAETVTESPKTVCVEEEDEENENWDFICNSTVQFDYNVTIVAKSHVKWDAQNFLSAGAYLYYSYKLYSYAKLF